MISNHVALLSTYSEFVVNLIAPYPLVVHTAVHKEPCKPFADETLIRQMIWTCTNCPWLTYAIVSIQHWVQMNYFWLLLYYPTFELKESLPGVTISSKFKTRFKSTLSKEVEAIPNHFDEWHAAPIKTASLIICDSYTKDPHTACLLDNVYLTQSDCRFLKVPWGLK